MEQEQTVCTSRTLIFLEMQNQLYGNTYTVFNEFCYFIFLLKILRFYWTSGFLMYFSYCREMQLPGFLTAFL